MLRLSYRPSSLFLLLCSVLLIACGGADPEPEGVGDGLGIASGDLREDGKPGLGGTGDEDPAGKADALQGRRGLPVSVDNSPTQVWEVRNAWEDRDTEAARKAGLAWDEDSGLSWEEKFRAWVGSLERTPTTNNFGETFRLTTPWGTKIDPRSYPGPALECAEVSMFLRITFASWYNLPFFMQAVDRNGNRVYFGHFGIRTANGRYGRTPNYRNAYEDHTEEYLRQRAELDPEARANELPWPSDSKLAERKIWGSFDDAQPMISRTAHAGAYFDAIFLNKRVGYFLLTHLTYFGSISLADSSNTYNIKPEAVEPGDALVERWQRSGIGHVLVVMERRELGEQTLGEQTLPLLEVELASGSMPRRQPRWESPAASKRYFTLDETGGPGYVDFKGGIKRYRAAKNISGRWANVVLADDATDFVNSRNKDELEKRPARFEQLLTELEPEEKLQALLEIVEGKRQWLREHPSSCSARIGREDAFDDIYELGEQLGMTREELDAKHRTFEDYVFAELVYGESKTCCWNSSSANMFEIVMDYNRKRVLDVEEGTCNPPLVFRAYEDDSDGFDVFRQHAETLERGDQWVTWSADEGCPQANVPHDREADQDATSFCSIRDELTF